MKFVEVIKTGASTIGTKATEFAGKGLAKAKANPVATTAVLAGIAVVTAYKLGKNSNKK